MAITWKELAYSADVEPALGNPAVTGYLLSSTDAGVRSWIAPSAGGGGDFLVMQVFS